MPELAMLPVGAGYNARDGQANLNIRRGQNDTIYIEATCDSLARQVIQLTEEITRIRNDTEQKTLPPVIVNEPTSWQWFWIRTGQMAAAVLVLFAIKWYLKTKKPKLW